MSHNYILYNGPGDGYIGRIGSPVSDIFYSVLITNYEESTNTSDMGTVSIVETPNSSRYTLHSMVSGLILYKIAKIEI